MKFGLFYLQQLPKPYDRETWGPDDEYRLYQEALEQIQLADELGYDYVFVVEHHFLEEYSHLSAPEVFRGAVTQRTKRIRLGHGIVILPPGINHPARVAERIATLDLLSGGRVEFGTGESGSEMELGGFGVPREAKKAMWEEALRECAKMLSQEPYEGHAGGSFAMPARNVIPKPRQRPHPPLWVAVPRRETLEVAARLGLGSIGFSFETAEECRERVADYWRILREECRPIGAAINPALATAAMFFCAETNAEALAKGVASSQFFGHALGYYHRAGPNHPAGRAHIYRDFIDTPFEERVAQLYARRAEQGRPVDPGVEPEDEHARALWRANRRGAAIGDPDYIRRHLRAYEAAGLDAMIFIAQASDRKHADVMRSIALFAREVMPEFRERHAAHQAWRERQLVGIPHPVNSSI
jgi:alkanesulfonate monooxygenase SsuD/methylene tetrahydromethanopterin reductase-like flavin-dependent oxidoreductase (luciferase family)